MLTSTTSTLLNRSLGNGLIMRSIRDSDDVERLAAFNGQIFGGLVTQMTRSLILSHPHTRPEHWLYVEDESTGQIVSSLGLIPWLWSYEGVTLKSGEMAIVGTHEDYRNRGLIRTLAVRHKELLHEGEYDLSHIQGIPYFYRQFGYEYAMSLESGWHVEFHNLPDVPSETAAAYHFRLATLDDLPLLMGMYDEAAATMAVHTIRDGNSWRFQFESTAGSETEGEFWLILDSAGQPVGYCRIAYHGFGKGLIISETSRLNHHAAEALLFQLKTLAVERSKPDIRLNLPENSDLVRLAKGWNAHNHGTYAWQIHLVDPARLLRKLAPVLERRIACSAFAGLDQHVYINLYRDTLDLHFERGKLLTVTSIGPGDQGEIRLPPLLLAPLLLGYRSRQELSYMYPDVGCWGPAQPLIDVMFPGLESFLFTIY